MSVDNELNRLKLLDVLQPKPAPIPLVRLGGNWDGAYLVPNDLKGIVACMSPGVSNVKRFEDELLDRYGIPSHMCDFSSDVESFRTPLKEGQYFRKQWLDVNAADNSISLEEWIASDVGEEGDLLLQMDIEGAEYRNLLATPESVLSRFRIIVIELHRLRQFNNPNRFAEELGPLLLAIDKHFVCVHAHPNNCEGDFKVLGSNRNLPNVHELTFLRRDRFERRKRRYQVLIPHPQDIPQNVAARPPVFLNQDWLAYERPMASKLRMLEDELAFMKRRLNDQADDIDRAWLSQHELASVIASEASLEVDEFPTENQLIENGLINLAEGRSFQLSGWHGPKPANPVVEAKEPCFFQTRVERHSRITIDLGQTCALSTLVLINRSDNLSDRARQLFFSVHEQDDDGDSRESQAIVTEELFLTTPGSRLAVSMFGRRGRFVSVFSTAVTALHFSDLQIWGTLEAS